MAAEAGSGPVRVAVGALVDARGRVLLSRRPPGRHLGGLWEFPGGKLEPGEGVAEALARELDEELGVRPLRARPLIRVPHSYPGKQVVLEVWRVSAWRGEPHGREGQPLAWVAPGDLGRYALPEADRPIVTALSLPALQAITPDPAEHGPALLTALAALLEGGVRLLQWRARAPSAGCPLWRQALALAERAGARLVLNAAPATALAAGAHGVQLNSARLRALTAPAAGAGQGTGSPPAGLAEQAALQALRRSGALVGASCHDAAELRQAAALGADYALLSPVRPTASHPGHPGLGWEAFAELVAPATLPVYALGGMQPEHCEQAWAAGAQGLAVLGGLWSVDSPAEAAAAYLASGPERRAGPG